MATPPDHIFEEQMDMHQEEEEEEDEEEEARGGSDINRSNITNDLFFKVQCAGDRLVLLNLLQTPPVILQSHS